VMDLLASDAQRNDCAASGEDKHRDNKQDGFHGLGHCHRTAARPLSTRAPRRCHSERQRTSLTSSVDAMRERYDRIAARVSVAGVRDAHDFLAALLDRLRLVDSFLTPPCVSAT
jgi:hypothetical protein